jgi:lysyl-tRNA synthetase, class II
MADTKSDLKQARVEKLEKLKSLGINPYPSSFDKKNTISEALNSLGKTVKIAGRLFSFREHGNIAFANLKDETGKIQIFFRKDLLKEDFKNIKLLDLGDFIGVEGEVIKTTAGEVSVAPNSFTLLTKSLLPLPSEWFGLKDTELRYRQRYLDLMLNPEVRERFNIRTKVVSGVREYLDNLGFWEVETPTLQSLYGGANAKPFKTHVNALGEDVFLRIADELYLKRLVVGGYERVYEICKDFRNEGIDHTHFPEFTMIEWYEAYADYERVMDVAEGLFKHLANKIYGNTQIQIEDKKIDIGKKWPRIEMTQILKDELGLDVEEETEKTLLAYIKKKMPEVKLAGGETKGQLIFIIFEHEIPSLLIEPTWIIDYPEDVSPLSKSHRSKPGWVERFEGYIGGKEIADGWSELTDPQIQRKRFISDATVARLDKEEAQHIDEDFLTAMEYGMPPTGGIGIGIDRLTMFFTNTWIIKEVMLFPTLKPQKEEARE